MSHFMAKAGRCGRVDGHTGQCRSLKAEAREQERQRERKTALGKHHMTQEQFEALVRKQHGLCRCGVPLGIVVHIDHDHACCPGRYSCGKCVRGVLHPSCNKAIGFVQDDPKALRALAEYLEAA